MVDTGINRLGLSPRRGRFGAARRARDRDVDEPSRLRRRGCRGQRSAAPRLRRARRPGAGQTAQPRQQRRHLPRRRLCLRAHPARPRPLRRRAAARGAKAISARSPGSRRRSSSAAGSRPARGVGYGGTFIAERSRELAILNIGYADGYLCGFSSGGRARIGDALRAVVGRVSMDLTAIRVDDAPELAEGDWIELDYDLPEARRPVRAQPI